MSATTTPRIYVACLASYNNGILYGKWLDVPADADELQEAINAMLAESTIPDAEEWAIHDFEGFGGWEIGENEDLENLCQYAEIVEELDGAELEAFQAWLANSSSNTPVDSDSLNNFRENYRGCWGSLADYVESYWEERGEYKNDSKNWWSPINYIDWARMAHDLELSGDVWTHDGSEGIHVFDNH